MLSSLVGCYSKFYHFCCISCSAHFNLTLVNSLCNVTFIFDNGDETFSEPALISFRGIDLLG